MDHISPWVGVAGLLLTVMGGAVAIAFNMGRLSQRMDELESRSATQSATHDAVIRLETEMKHMKEGVTTLDRHMQGVHRQLGNIASSKFGAPNIGGQ